MTSPFTLHRPHDVGEASALLAQFGDGAAFYCGGTELLQVMKMGLASFEHLIDLKGIEALRGISVTDDGWLVIGAAVTHREIERSPLIARHMPELAALEKHVANIRVRNSGTLGGNLCFAEPHSDPATLLVAAGAVLRLARQGSERDVPLSEFVVGALETVREPDEVLVWVRVPPVGRNTSFAYRKIAFKERPVASVAARVTLDGGAISDALLVVGSVGDRPRAIDGVAQALRGHRPNGDDDALAEAARLAAEGCEATSEIDTSEEYQRHLVAVLARQALDAAVRQAAGQGEAAR